MYHTKSVYDKKQLDWDVELKGNPSFPGRDGRIQTEMKLEKYGALLAASANAAPTLVPQLQGEVDELAKRREDIADTKHYTDLPDWVRQSELAKLDAQIGKFEALRHAAAIDAMKRNPGESSHDISIRWIDEHAYDKLPPTEKKLAQLRDEIAVLDSQILAAERDNAEASAAQRDGFTLSGNRMSKDLLHRADGYQGAEATEKLHERVYTNLDALRIPFIANLGNPDEAIPYAEALLTALQATQSMAMAATDQFDDAAKARLAMKSDNGTIAKEHADYWTMIQAREESDQAEAQARQ